MAGTEATVLRVTIFHISLPVVFVLAFLTTIAADWIIQRVVR
jgi:hypothetical protein